MTPFFKILELDPFPVNHQIIEKLLAFDPSDVAGSTTNQYSAQLHAAFALSPVATMFLDLSSLRMSVVNAAAEMLFHLDAEEMGRTSLLDFVPERETPTVRQLVSELQTGQRDSCVTLISAGDGIGMARFLMRRVGDQIVAIDISSSRQSGGTSELAATDALTGLPNRSQIDQRIQQALDRGDASWGVLFIDLNNYKQVNDDFGHVVGDDVLVEFAGKLRATIRPGDLLGRYGGDEFVVFVDRVTSIVQLQTIATRIRKEVTVQVRGSNPVITVTSSIGCAMPTAGTRTIVDIISAADQDMYRMKRRLPR